MLSREISESADVTHPGLSDMSRDMEGQESRAPVTRMGVVTAIVTSIGSIVGTTGGPGEAAPQPDKDTGVMCVSSLICHVSL